MAGLWCYVNGLTQHDRLPQHCRKPADRDKGGNGRQRSSTASAGLLRSFSRPRFVGLDADRTVRPSGGHYAAAAPALTVSCSHLWKGKRSSGLVNVAVRLVRIVSADLDEAAGHGMVRCILRARGLNPVDDLDWVIHQHVLKLTQ